MNNSKNQIDMTSGSIFPKLMKFSIPLILSSLLQLLFNAADVIVVGRFAGDNSLAAVGSTTSLINLIINLFMGLSIGTNVVAAHYLGAQKKEELHDTVQTAIILSVISGLILTLIGVFATKQILVLMKAPEPVLPLAALYLRIYFSGIISTMIFNFGSALLRAKGDTKRPLYILFFSGIINVILNLFFVIVLKLDVAGVSIATIISQTISAVCIIVILLKEKDEFHLDLKQLKINYTVLVRILKIGLPAGFQGIVFSLSNVIIQSSINSYGEIIVAGSAAAANVETFVYTAMNGFSQGTLTFVSQNRGAGNFSRIKKVTLISLLTVSAIGIIFGNAVILFSRRVLSAFTKSQAVIEQGRVRLIYVCSLYLLCGIMDTMSNAIRGMGHSVLPMIVSLTGACGVRLLWLATVWRNTRFHTIGVIYSSYPISWFITFVAHVICFLVIYNTMKKGKNLTESSGR